MNMQSNTNFRELCEKMRFTFDYSTDHPRVNGSSIADFVARVCLNGLRVTPTTTPQIYKTLQTVTDKLHLNEIPEVYVINEPSANTFVEPTGREGVNLRATQRTYCQTSTRPKEEEGRRVSRSV